MSRIEAAVRDALGADLTGTDPGFGSLTLDVAPEGWADAARAAFGAGATYLDLLTAYDLLDDGFAVVAHVSAPDASDHVLLRTRVPREDPAVASLLPVYRGAAWHERETAEMFGVRFTGHDPAQPLLLDPAVVSTPLRKDVVLVARAARPWPGDSDPADSGGRPRRRTPPPGVPADWPREGT